ncbi:hypothetical protein ACH347_42370 [Saccharopolyspora sp. 5N102]|uniref:hypothetical protein n=1 Tax=Saccharopolyspora sp. 5N102 TaxID=3375155 RepID=UPI0037974D62
MARFNAAAERGRTSACAVLSLAASVDIEQPRRGVITMCVLPVFVMLAAGAVKRLPSVPPGRQRERTDWPVRSWQGRWWDRVIALGIRFEELDCRDTPLGVVSLRRRRDPLFEVDVYEVKLGDEYLMSSLFTVAEVALARLGLAELAGTGFDVVVGGLGLGYTARAVLEDPRVRSLVVVEALDEVIGWHQRALLPLSTSLTKDPRNRMVHGDFFAMADSAAGFDSAEPDRRFHAVLVDIDHSPRHLLSPSHAGFYTADGLRRLARHLYPDGVFALWSDDPPDQDFTTTLEAVFATVDAHVVTFDNPYSGGKSANTVYVTRLGAASSEDGEADDHEHGGRRDCGEENRCFGLTVWGVCVGC